MQEEFLNDREGLGAYSKAFKEGIKEYAAMRTLMNADINQARRTGDKQSQEIAETNDIEAVLSDLSGNRLKQRYIDARNVSPEHGQIIYEHQFEMLGKAVERGLLPVAEYEDWIATNWVCNPHKCGTVETIFPGKFKQAQNVITKHRQWNNERQNSLRTAQRLEAEAAGHRIQVAWDTNADRTKLREALEALPNNQWTNKIKEDWAKRLNPVNQVSDGKVAEGWQLASQGGLNVDWVRDNIPPDHPAYKGLMAKAEAFRKNGVNNTERMKNDAFKNYYKGLDQALLQHTGEAILPGTGTKSGNRTFPPALTRAQTDFKVRVTNYQMEGDSLSVASAKANEDFQKDLERKNGIYALESAEDGVDKGFQEFINLDDFTPEQKNEYGLKYVQDEGPAALNNREVIPKEMAERLGDKFTGGVHRFTWGETYHVRRVADSLPGVTWIDVVNKQRVFYGLPELELAQQVEQLRATNPTPESIRLWKEAINKPGESKVAQFSLNPLNNVRNPAYMSIQPPKGVSYISGQDLDRQDTGRDVVFANREIRVPEGYEFRWYNIGTDGLPATGVDGTTDQSLGPNGKGFGHYTAVRYTSPNDGREYELLLGHGAGPGYTGINDGDVIPTGTLLQIAGNSGRSVNGVHTSIHVNGIGFTALDAELLLIIEALGGN